MQTSNRINLLENTAMFARTMFFLNMQLDIIWQPLGIALFGTMLRFHIKIETSIFEIQIERRQKALSGWGIHQIHQLRASAWILSFLGQVCLFCFGASPGGRNLRRQILKQWTLAQIETPDTFKCRNTGLAPYAMQSWKNIFFVRTSEKIWYCSLLWMYFVI